MKTETKYVCEFCGFKYNTEEECQKCEQFHQQATAISSQKFEHKYGDDGKYPGTVVLEMANGHKVIYRFHKPIVEKPEP